MSPHPPAGRRHHRRARVLAGTALALTLAATACGPPTAQWDAHAPSPTPGAGTSRQPDATGEPGSSTPPGPTASGPASSPGASATPTGRSPLAYYLDRLPTFDPAPIPEPVDLPHAPGHAAWVTRIPTTQKVAFLTIDDGVVKSPYAEQLLLRSKVRVTLFLTINDISDDKDYFTTLQDLGNPIEAHTITHPELPALSYDSQRYELCHGADLLGQWYDRRPVIFRPPYGDKNDATLRAAWSCGLRAGFFWKETVNSGTVRFQTANHVVQPGDIILMHFRTTFAQDFLAALQAIKAAGLVPALLDDYVLVDGSPLDTPLSPGPITPPPAG